MAQQEFPQLPYKYGDGLRGAAIAQTRDGKDELITPVALWERNRNNGLYLPPGMLDDADVAKPRVEATLTGSIVEVNRGPGSTVVIAPGAETVLETIDWASVEFKAVRYTMKIDNLADTGLIVRWEGSRDGIDWTTNLLYNDQTELENNIERYDTGFLTPTSPFNRLVVENNAQGDRYIRRWGRVATK